MIRATRWVPLLIVCSSPLLSQARGVCYRAREASHCRHYVVSDISFANAVAKSETNAFEGAPNPAPQPDYPAKRVHWAVGVARNITAQHALAAAAIINHKGHAFGGAELRFRRWSLPPATLKPRPEDADTPPAFEIALGYSRARVTRVFQCTGTPPGPVTCTNQPNDDPRVMAHGARLSLMGSVGPIGIFGRGEAVTSQGSIRSAFYFGLSGHDIGALVGSLIVLGADVAR